MATSGGEPSAAVLPGSDLSALSWVRDELRRSLELANKALHRYLKEAAQLSELDSVDPGVLRQARTQLHQSVGVLELVGFGPAAELLRAAEAALHKLSARPRLITPASVGTLERGSFALLDFIDRRLAGKPVSALALFPQYRALQELAGASRIHPADLWEQTWSWRELALDGAVAVRHPDAATSGQIEVDLLALMRGAPPAVAARMCEAFAGLAVGAQAAAETAKRAAGGAVSAAAPHSRLATLWQLASGFFEAQADALLLPDAYSKRLGSKLLAQLRGGELSDPSQRLAQDLLFFCGQARSRPGQAPGPRLAAVQQGYGLATGSPVDYEQTRLGRFDPAWVAQARKRVAAAKEVWSAVAGGDSARLAGLPEQFALVSDSLARLYPDGALLGRALQVAAAHASALGGEPPAALAMEVATALLYLDASLDDGEFDHPDGGLRIQRLAQRIDAVRQQRDPGTLDLWMEELYRRVSDRQTMGSVVQELRASLSEIEKDIDQYFRDPAQRDGLIPVPAKLSAMRGVLSVLGLDQASQAVLRMRDDVDALANTEVDAQRAIETGTFDRLADNLGALSFLIDMVSVQPQLAKSLFHFDPVTGSLAAVMAREDRPTGFDDLDTRPHEAPPGAADTDALAVTLDFDRMVQQARGMQRSATPGAGLAAGSVGTASPFAAQGMAPTQAQTLNLISLDSLDEALPAEPDPDSAAGAADHAPPAPVPSGLENDPEMRLVFLEEALEVLQGAREALAELQQRHDDVDAMTRVRRSFHNLKGSARMVGLLGFAEAAWVCEQLYNSRLADHAGADADLRHFSAEACRQFEAWVHALEAGDDSGHGPQQIVSAADALRSNQRRPPHPITAPTPLVDAWVDSQIEPTLDLRLSDSTPRAAGHSLGHSLGNTEPTALAELASWRDLPLPTPQNDHRLQSTTPEPTLELRRRVPDLPLASDLDLLLSPAVPTPTPPPTPTPTPSATAVQAEISLPEIDLSALDDEPAAAAEPPPAGPTVPAFDSGSEPSMALPEATEIDLDFGALFGPLAGAEPTELELVEPIEVFEPTILLAPTPAAAPPHAAPLDSQLPEPTIQWDRPAEAGRIDASRTAQAEADSTAVAGERPVEPLIDALDSASQAAAEATLDLSEAAPALSPETVSKPMPAPTAPLLAGEASEPSEPSEAAAAGDAAASGPGAGADDSEAFRQIGPLRISLPLFNIYLGEADELSHRLELELAEWTLEQHRPVGEAAVSLAHSLAGSSGTVGYAGLSQLARALEHALERSQARGQGRDGEAVLFSRAADEIRRLLHLFAAGFLYSADADLLSQLQTLAHAAPETVADVDTAWSLLDGDEPVAAIGDDSARTALSDPAETTTADLPQPQAALPEPEPEPEPAAAAATTPPVGPQASPLAALDDALPELPELPELGALGRAALLPFAALPETAPRPLRVDADAAGAQFDEDIDEHDTLDEELFPIFLEEAQELLPRLHAGLRDWAGAPPEGQRASACMRCLHTFKGAARLAGAMRLGELAHRLESAIERLLVPGATPGVGDIERLMSHADSLQARLDGLQLPAAMAAPLPPAAQQRAQVSLPVLPQALLAAVPSLLPAASTTGLPAAAEAARPAELPAEAARPAELLAEAVGAPASPTIDWQRFIDPSDAPVGLLNADQALGASTGSVRVRTPLLDRLVNQAGEVSIARSRIESDVGQIKGALVDLADNLDRLRSQLRDIELQAETQIDTRMEAARVAAQAFDPLELDRFTRFQELTRMMAESVSDVATVQRGLQRTLQSTEDALAQQARMTRDMQDDLLRTRMVEFEGLSERLYRVVRQAAKDAGRPVRLDIVGGSVEIDRGVLDRMTPAFEHLLRNCVAHGIEPAEARAAAGKDAIGTITLVITQSGNEVGVEVRDDGAGLQLARILERGRALGLVAPFAEPGAAELANLIFHPGFSTAAELSGLSGRGFGMDVVRTEVNAMGGRIETASAPGQGTSFRLVLPLTTAVTQVVMLRCGERVFAVPSTLIEIVRRVKLPELAQAYETASYNEGGQVLPFFWLDALLQGSPRGLIGGRSAMAVVIRSAAQRVVLHVDEVLRNQDVVVKRLGPQLSRVPGLVGITLLPSGLPALIYNPVALATLYGDAARTATAAALAAAGGGAAAWVTAQALPRAPLVLVVDDSLTVRRITQRLLEREGYRVQVAKDGLDGLEKLAAEMPVILLTDIEMPRMDGFDLVRNMRADSRLAELPVVMITSRIAQKHRDYAAELGVDHYLGKPYVEGELLSLVARYARHSARPLN